MRAARARMPHTCGQGRLRPRARRRQSRLFAELCLGDDAASRSAHRITARARAGSLHRGAAPLQTPLDTRSGRPRGGRARRAVEEHALGGRHAELLELLRVLHRVLHHLLQPPPAAPRQGRAALRCRAQGRVRVMPNFSNFSGCSTGYCTTSCSRPQMLRVRLGCRAHDRFRVRVWLQALARVPRLQLALDVLQAAHVVPRHVGHLDHRLAQRRGVAACA